MDDEDLPNAYCDSENACYLDHSELERLPRIKLYDILIISKAIRIDPGMVGRSKAILCMVL
jgi:hypothetical protein